MMPSKPARCLGDIARELDKDQAALLSADLQEVVVSDETRGDLQKEIRGRIDSATRVIDGVLGSIPANDTRLDEGELRMKGVLEAALKRRSFLQALSDYVNAA